MALEASNLPSPLTSETLEIAQELRLQNNKDSDTVAEFLNQKLAELEARRKEVEAEERGPNICGWGVLPDLILERIFSYLTAQQRYYAGCTCIQWNKAFYFRSIWSVLNMKDVTLCRRRFDYGDRSWRYSLDHYKTQQLISHVGHHLRRLTCSPTTFFGLFAHYHFMNHISSYAERFEEDPDSVQGCQFKIENFRFVFFCDMASSRSDTSAGSCIIGTGGDILASLTRLIGNMKHLRRLDFIDLLLVPEDATQLLTTCSFLWNQLKILTLVNLTKDCFMLHHLACFISIRILYMSPQNLGDEVVGILANSINLREIHIVHNSYGGVAEPVDPKSWQKVNRFIKIFLRTSSRQDKEIIWQEKANVTSVIYECPMTKFATSAAVTVIDLYSDTLNEFGYFGLPKFQSSRKFENRIDASLLSLCRKCPNLTTLFVRDRISTSTALLIVSMSPNLKNFYVRRNALLLKIDFMFHFNLFLDFNFSLFITLNAKSYEKTTREIAKILGNPSWKLQSDKEFKIICANRPAY